jgi:hypothetical protein
VVTAQEALPLTWEHAKVKSYRAQAQLHGVSHETMRGMVVAELRALLNRTYLDLIVAWKLEADGHMAEFPGLAIPHGPDYTTGLDVFSLIVDELRKTDEALDIKVITRPTPNGLCLFLTLASSPFRGGDS